MTRLCIERARSKAAMPLDELLSRHGACQLAAIDVQLPGASAADDSQGVQLTGGAAAPAELRYLRAASPPSAWFCMAASRLAVLDLSGCSSGIVRLPHNIGDLTALQHLDLSRCAKLAELPVRACGGWLGN